MKKIFFLSLTALGLVGTFIQAAPEPSTPNQQATSKQELKEMTPDQALQKLKDGNEYFVKHFDNNGDYIKMIADTAKSQHPFAMVLGCMDSRVPAEVIFNQGIGNIFVTRVAGLVLDDDILASMEYATKVVGSKVILIMGHERCGAVIAATKNYELGHITQLIEKIKPSVEAVRQLNPDADLTTYENVEKVSRENVRQIMKAIPEKSAIIKELVAQNKIVIKGAMYDLDTGVVEFFNEN